MICIQTGQKEYVNFGLRLNISIFFYPRLRGNKAIKNIRIYTVYIIFYTRFYRKKKGLTADVIDRYNNKRIADGNT